MEYKYFIMPLTFLFTLWSLSVLFEFLDIPKAVYMNYLLWFVILVIFSIFLPYKNSVFLDD